jgi:sec-independent protein translocase protein TatA
MFGLGYQELLLILVIVLVLFGGSKLPDLAKSLGKSMKEFKKGIAAEPEDESRSSTPARSVAVTPMAPRTCSSCQSQLDVAWAHCPRCGTIVAPDSTPTLPK